VTVRGCGAVEAGGDWRRVAGGVGAGAGVEEAGSLWRTCLKRQSVNLQFPLFQKNRQMPLGQFSGRGLDEPLGAGVAGAGAGAGGPEEEGALTPRLCRSCRPLQLAPRRQPAGVLKNTQTFRCDMVGMGNLATFVSSRLPLFLFSLAGRLCGLLT